MISHYTRQSTYHTFFDTQFDNRMYSMPDYFGWKWVHISTLRVSHLHHAVRLQMLAIQKIEEILADLFLDEGSKENHKQIDRFMRRMSMRYKRLSMLGDEYATRSGKVPFNEIPAIRNWFDGDRLNGEYPYPMGVEIVSGGPPEKLPYPERRSS